MPKAITNPGPPCDCHGVPKLWNAAKSKPSGGSWLCRVRANERKTQQSRREGHLPFGSPEHLQRLHDAQVGRAHPPDCGHCLAQTGRPLTEAPSYGGAHQRHRKALAHLPCAHADESCKGRIHCALRAETSPERLTYNAANKCWYSPRTEDYMPLCASHHRRYDFAHPRPKVA